MTDTIAVTDRDGTRLIRMDRPQKKNALTLDMYRAMTAAIRSGEQDDAVLSYILCGAPGAFSAGNDLNDFLAHGAAGATTVGSPILEFLDTILRATKPLIAAVDGVAVGIGTTMLMHCDFVYATPGSRFQLPFVNLGLVPEAASSLILPRRVGHQKAAEILLLGEPFDAAAALGYGMVNAVVEPDALMDHALGVARKLAAKPQGALRRSKALLKADVEVVAARIAQEAEVFNACLRSAELREAVAAFMEQRPPDFSRCGQG
ncbi:enoyl-CoA hydratase [Azospirillum sp.]|uniref:enoyl-CoA hydratase n=1 Tax=Azospirillum sp. TaxID=34012 RepID=UPI003D742F14